MPRPGPFSPSGFPRLAIYCNAQMSSRHIRKFCQIDASSGSLLESAIDRLGLSARAYNRILKISRTIADLEGIPGYLRRIMWQRPFNIEPSIAAR